MDTLNDIKNTGALLHLSLSKLKQTTVNTVMYSTVIPWDFIHCNHVLNIIIFTYYGNCKNDARTKNNVIIMVCFQMNGNK